MKLTDLGFDLDKPLGADNGDRPKFPETLEANKDYTAVIVGFNDYAPARSNERDGRKSQVVNVRFRLIGGEYNGYHFNHGFWFASDGDGPHADERDARKLAATLRAFDINVEEWHFPTDPASACAAVEEWFHKLVRVRTKQPTEAKNNPGKFYTSIAYVAKPTEEEQKAAQSAYDRYLESLQPELEHYDPPYNEDDDDDMPI